MKLTNPWHRYPIPSRKAILISVPTFIHSVIPAISSFTTPVTSVLPRVTTEILQVYRFHCLPTLEIRAGPVLNKNGEVVGILSAREADAEGVVFAIKSNGIYDMLNDLKKEDTSYQSIKMPLTSNLKKLDREQQIKKVADYVYQVKVYN